MKKITLFVGDCTESLAVVAKQFDSEAVLINSTNYEKFQTTSNGYTAYTSLADLPNQCEILYDLLLLADSVHYCPPSSWSDQKNVDPEDVTNSIQGLTEFYLGSANKIKNHVVGLDLSRYSVDAYLKLVAGRNSPDPQLWVIGCSTTAGIGVEQNQTYGYLLSQRLNLPVSVLATNASSISWAADQILRSDIQKNDILVWGLTQENRFTLWDEDRESVAHVIPNTTRTSYGGLPTKTIEQLLVHKTNFFTAIQKVFEVVNFCQKIKAKLLIFNVHSSSLLNIHLHGVKEFFTYVNKPYHFADFGTDNLHPGPIQHKLYADFCQQQLKNLNYI